MWVHIHKMVDKSATIFAQHYVPKGLNKVKLCLVREGDELKIEHEMHVRKGDELITSRCKRLPRQQELILQRTEWLRAWTSKELPSSTNQCGPRILHMLAVDTTSAFITWSIRVQPCIYTPNTMLQRDQTRSYHALITFINNLPQQHFTSLLTTAFHKIRTSTIVHV